MITNYDIESDRIKFIINIVHFRSIPGILSGYTLVYQVYCIIHCGKSVIHFFVI
jgi:hypothetical protein